MQTPSYFPAILPRLRRRAGSDPFQQHDPGFFDTHPVSEILRSVFFATLQWGLLACAIYTVYSMVLGSH